MYNKQLISRIKEIFQSKLATKTNWGRNEVISLHTESVNEALIELVDTYE